MLGLLSTVEREVLIMPTAERKRNCQKTRLLKSRLLCSTRTSLLQPSAILVVCGEKKIRPLGIAHISQRAFQLVEITRKVLFFVIQQAEINSGSVLLLEILNQI